MRYIYYFLLLALPYTLASQTTFNLRYHFDTPACYLTSIVATDSCYYAIGIYADTFPWIQVGSIFTKVNLDGTPVFTRKLIDPYKSFETRLKTLTPLEDGTFVTVAYSYDPYLKGMLMKYDDKGDTLWTREYLNPFYPTQTFIVPITMVQTEDEGFGIACWVQKTGNSGDIYLIKTDSIGEIEWGSVYGNTQWDRPYSLVLTPEGKMILGAARSNVHVAWQNYTWQNHIFQVDETGAVEWTYLSPNSTGLLGGAADMVLLDDGSLIVASRVGQEYYFPASSQVRFDKYIFKLNPMREIEWELTFPQPTPTMDLARLTNIIATSDGSGFVAAGMHAQDFPSQNAFSLKGWLGKVSPSGDSLWTRQYVGIDQLNNRHTIYDLKETPDGGFILCGESRNPNTLAPGEIAQQAWLLKLDQYGCLVPGCHITTSAAEPEPERLHLALYPNPAAEYLNFYLRAPAGVGSEVSFRIFDAGGRLLREFPHASPDATYVVSVWDWPAGLYVLQCVSGGQVLAVEKFLKQ
ncbi:MAG: T9SS type A sorting domain-containing protein [Saprospiraceae bacterium]|nr:T9SS type A sorting domain-containing protein [Saprospiraceae bacterium]